MSSFRGSLPEYGNIKIDVCPNIIEITRFGDPGPRFLDYTTFSINNVGVTKEEAELIMEEIKSQAGELTTADFYPDKVEEILKRVQIESSPVSS